jgi:hypothetical protein
MLERKHEADRIVYAHGLLQLPQLLLASIDGMRSCAQESVFKSKSMCS